MERGVRHEDLLLMEELLASLSCRENGQFSVTVLHSIINHAPVEGYTLRNIWKAYIYLDVNKIKGDLKLEGMVWAGSGKLEGKG